ncbi:unnamed protein product [Heterobilharzia americana]|nr:unnamed protein product [Heterobilharzia americana]
MTCFGCTSCFLLVDENKSIEQLCWLSLLQMNHHHHQIKSPSGIPRLLSLNDTFKKQISPSTSELITKNNHYHQNGGNYINNEQPCNDNNNNNNNAPTTIPTSPTNSSYSSKSVPIGNVTISSSIVMANTSIINPGYQRPSRSRAMTQSVTRPDRTTSECPHKSFDVESDTSSVFSSSGPPKPISSKVGSLQNAKHKPGGGNVQIFNEKVTINTVRGKCNSMANVKHKPGGGNVQIVDEKLDFTSNTQSKIRSLQNVKHIPGGGDIKISTEKLDFNQKATSKVGSLANVKYNPTGGDVKIFNEHLPWLKYNKPNLPAAERDRINKRSSGNNSDMTTSLTSGSTGH